MGGYVKIAFFAFSGWVCSVLSNVKIDYKSSNPQLDSLIVFECVNNKLKINGGNNIPIEISDNSLTLKIEEQTQATTYTLKAYAILKGNIKTPEIGRLQIVSKPLAASKKVRIIRVKRNNEDSYYDFSPDQKQALVDSLNLLYKQAFLSFELDNSNYTDTFDINKSTTQPIGSLKDNLYDPFPNKESNVYFIFVCSPSPNEGISGNGRLSGNYSIVFNQSSVTATHELGHNLGLQHIFENKDDGKSGVCRVGTRIIPQNTTNNIMDYIYSNEIDKRRYFLKYQIDYLKSK